MTKKFKSKDDDFSARVRFTYITLIFITPLCTLALIALGYGIGHIDKVRARGKIRRILEGFSLMDETSILISFIIGIIITVGLIIFLKSYYQQREIVIALEFDDQSKQLTVRSKRIDGQEFNRTHKYAELSLAYDHLSDGMTSPMYNTITLVKGNFLAGHIYVDHFTWDATVLAEIKMKLKTIL